MNKYEQLKKDLMKFEEMYGSGPLVIVLQQARLAIIDMEKQIPNIKSEVKMICKGDHHNAYVIDIIYSDM